MKENNITNLNEYKSENLQNEVMIEEMSPEMLDAYYKSAEENTPNLWAKIEHGFEVECSSIRLEKQNEKRRKRKVMNAVAAGVIVTVIAVPVMIIVSQIGSGDKEKSSDVKYDMIYDNDEKNDGTESMMEESVMEESAQVSDDTEMSYEESVENNDNVTQTESENASDYVTESESTGTMNHEGSGYEEIIDERLLVVDGELTDFNYESYMVKFRVDEVLSNEYEEYDIKRGDVIVISNPMTIYIMNNEFISWRIEFDSLTINEKGEYEARINSLEIPD